MNAPPSTPVRTLDLAEWLELAASFRDHGYTQGWGYSQGLARLHGARSEHVALYDGDALLGLAAVRLKDVPFLGSGLAFLSGGPLVRRGSDEDPDALARCVELLRDEYVERRGRVLRVRPPLGLAGHEEQVDERLRALGLAPAEGERRYHTLVLDMRPEPDALRAAFSKRWRRHLNQSFRKDFEVRHSTESADFAKFCALFDEMIGRKRFATDLDAHFYAELQGGLDPAERFEVWLAEVEGEAVGGLVTSCLGDSVVYVLGASGPRARDLCASHRLHWEVILDARERGLERYDLGGIDAEANPGVTTFKAGIADIDLWAPGPYQCVPRSLGGRLVPKGEWLYKKSRGLVARLRARD